MANVKAIPEGFHTITADLAVEGAAEAMEFYKKAFGAVEVSRAPDPSGKRVWHGHMRIGDSNLFLADIMPDMPTARGGRLWLYFENVDHAWKRATDAGAKVLMPLGDMFWGDRMGALVDRWGVYWSLAQHVRDMTPAEMKKAQDEFVANMAKQKR